MTKKNKKFSSKNNKATSIPDEPKDDDESHDEFDANKMFREQNKKRKSGGGFQRMGLSNPVLKGILRKGYKVPTPIQRKTIPLIMEGKDVVAMARTGSGKTAAFLIPMFERLKVHSVKSGARALILSPTRELALQTLKFTKELGRMTGLRAVVVLGGDKIEDQFTAIHENPDIIIATPGRFLHILVEMDLKLSSVEYVVFDEADRLFEMGFQEQLHEILNRLSENRQTLLFSATLPRLLADFAKAGLSDPELIRLDVDSNLSENLKTAYFFCRSDDKTAILLHILTSVVRQDELTVVFLATRHHVDYICELLRKAEITFSYVYSTLDQTARKIEIAKFQSRKSTVLLVTDIAARGIDIPLLDNVVNYNFPAKPKLFVHRVGRVARAGRSGNAYSIVSPDEAPFMLDLHLFLGRPLKLAQLGMTDTASLLKTHSDGVIGTLPQRIIDEESDLIRTWHESSPDLKSTLKVSVNAYKQYIKSRPAPSSESVKRMKDLSASPPTLHPIFQGTDDTTLEEKRNAFLLGMKTYRPNCTTFEIGATAKNQASGIMRAKKRHHDKVIEKARQQRETAAKGEEVETTRELKSNLEIMKDEDVQVTFGTFGGSKRANRGEVMGGKRQKTTFQDQQYYLSYQSSDLHVEKGLELDKSFNRRIVSEVLDMTGDDSTQFKQNKTIMTWDKKKKKFLKDPGVDPKRKKIKTESGVWIPASYKSNIYKQWKERNKVEQQQQQEDSEGEGQNQFGKPRPGMTKRHTKKGGSRGQKRELKTKEEILKTRQKKERIQFHQKRRQIANTKRRNIHRKDRRSKR